MGMNKEIDYELIGNTPDDYRLKKNIGIISALPSEYLLHFRKGFIGIFIFPLQDKVTKFKSN